MAALALDFEQIHEPTKQEIDAAGRAVRALACVDKSQPVRLVVDNNDMPDVALPSGIFSILMKMLAEIGNGNAVTVVPILADLTTTQAAELLNVSRPHVIKLIERGELDHKMVGTHRKVLARSALEYQAKTHQKRGEALDQLSELDEELELYEDDSEALCSPAMAHA